MGVRWRNALVMINFTKKEIGILMDAVSYVGSVAASGCWYIWDHWREYHGERHWDSISWNSYWGKQIDRQYREMLRYLTVKGTWKCT